MTPGLLEHYSIFCGTVLYSKPRIPCPEFPGWEIRVSSFPTLIDYLGKAYHEQYFSKLFSQTPQAVIHQTCRHLLESPLEFSLSDLPEHSFAIKWLDRYLFPDGLALFAFRVESVGENDYSAVTDLIRHFRSLDCALIVQARGTKLVDLLQQYLSPGLSLGANWNRHLNKLKHYTIINDNKEKSLTVELKDALFELAHAMPIGSVKSNSSERPTQEYYDKVFHENAVEVYANWKAIALFDSITRLSVQFDDEYLSWELDYFHIYIYCLYFKYRLYEFNAGYVAASRDRKAAKALKESFDSLAAELPLSSISHKFLPNLLFEKIRGALHLVRDMEDLESKMNRLTTLAEQQGEAMMRESIPRTGSIVDGFVYDVVISFHPKDNLQGWVTQFARSIHDELSTVVKEEMHIYLMGEEKLRLMNNALQDCHNTVIFLPVLSHNYCNRSAGPWKDELIGFVERVRSANKGMDVELRNGNIASRILPVCIYELDDEDRALFESGTGLGLRSIDFVYREPGVNRPLRPEDPANESNLKANYRNQLNKLANAIKEIMGGMKKKTRT